jgi:hypothetical protein
LDAQHGLARDMSFAERREALEAGQPSDPEAIRAFLFARPELVELIRNPPTILHTFDLGGHVVETWRAPGPWDLVAVNPDRHLLVVTNGPGQAPEHFIFAYRAKTVLSRWPPAAAFWKAYFAEGGKTVCAVESYGRQAAHAECRDADSAKEVARFPGFPAGLPASVSSQGSRIVLTHARYIRGINEEFDRHSYQDRVVWDFRTGKVVAEWVPITQVTETGLKPPEDKRTEFGRSVISPSGRYIAEGSNGILRIYEVR